MEILPDPVHVALLVVPFLVTMMGLHVILWRPLLDWLDAREHTTEQARKEAADLTASADEQLTRLEERLAAARAGAVQIRSEARAAAQAKEAEILAGARTQAEDKVQQAVGEIATSTEAARSALKSTAEDLSGDIVAQVLGRSVA